MGSDVFWIKLQTNTFDSETIMLLESMPEGDTILIIWLKMQILAGRCNAGGFLLLNGESPYSDEMLATVFRRPLNTVRLAISAFLKFKMVEIIGTASFTLFGLSLTLQASFRLFMRETPVPVGLTLSVSAIMAVLPVPRS